MSSSSRYVLLPAYCLLNIFFSNLIIMEDKQMKEIPTQDLLYTQLYHYAPQLPHSRSSLDRSSAPTSIDRSSLHRRRPGADHDQATTLTSSALQASLASPNAGAGHSDFRVHKHDNFTSEHLLLRFHTDQISQGYFVF
ncbi:hypothetical protein LXL04_032306 [Taraxacum kok-saghyz]